MVKHLDTKNYGLWLTISAFISWFRFLDMGIAQGLQNKFAEARALNNEENIKGYVSTAYITVGFVSLILFILILSLNFFIDWSYIFGVEQEYLGTLRILMPILVGFIGLQLCTGLIVYIYLADKIAFISNAINFSVQLLSVIGILLIVELKSESILSFSILLGVVPVLLFILVNLLGFRNRYKRFKPTFSYWKKEYLSDIFGVGIKFLILQICVIVLFASDSFIISHYIGPAEVVPYNISYKYFGIISQIQLIILTPYWSVFTDAYVKKEFDWINKKMKKLVVFAIIMILGLVIFYFLAPVIYDFWIGNSQLIPRRLDFIMMIYFSILIFYAPFNYFINGTGKITFHTISFVFSALVNIPLSILLAVTFKMGVNGVLISTIICVLPYVFLFPIQYKYLIKGNTKGILAK